MTTAPRTYQSIMVSSTFTDLEEHRAKVIEAIQHHRFYANVMEYSGAAIGPDVLDKSLAMVAESAAYVLVIGHRYGQCPIDPDRNAQERSITELEFDEAVRLKLPVLLFVIADKHPVTKATGGWETDPTSLAKLEAFIRRAKLADPTNLASKVERVWGAFVSHDDFAQRAAIAIGKLAVEFRVREALADEVRRREVTEEERAGDGYRLNSF